MNAQRPSSVPPGPVLTQKLRQHPIQCSMCKVQAKADVYTCSLADYQFPWLRMPSGWWSALPSFAENGEVRLLVRCPQCLNVSGRIPRTQEPAAEPLTELRARAAGGARRRRRRSKSRGNGSQ